MDLLLETILKDSDKIFPLLLVILGYILKKAHVVKKEIADSLIKVVFYVFLPATIFYSIVQLPLKSTLIILPVAGFSVALLCYLFGFLIKDFLGMGKKTQGSFLIACGAMNQGMFTYPFFLMYLGTTGLSYVAFYDVGQAFLALTLGYYIAVRHGSCSQSADLRKLTGKILAFPPLWAFSSALSVNYLRLYQLTQLASPLIEILHNCTVPLIMLSLGIFLEPRIKEGRAMLAVIFTRFILSLFIACLIVSVFNLEGLERITVLIASAAPPAMITLVYCGQEKLDVEFTAALISVCIIIGLIYTPLLFTLLG